MKRRSGNVARSSLHLRGHAQMVESDLYFETCTPSHCRRFSPSPLRELQHEFLSYPNSHRFHRDLSQDPFLKFTKKIIITKLQKKNENSLQYFSPKLTITLHPLIIAKRYFSPPKPFSKLFKIKRIKHVAESEKLST